MRDDSNYQEFDTSQSYKVGYRKPPIAGQFRPGNSGNPKGRPKNSTSTICLIRKELKNVMDETVEGMMNGRPTTMKMVKALARKAVADAMNSRPRLLEAFIRLDTHAELREGKKKSKAPRLNGPSQKPTEGMPIIKIVFEKSEVAQADTPMGSSG